MTRDEKRRLQRTLRHVLERIDDIQGLVESCISCTELDKMALQDELEKLKAIVHDTGEAMHLWGYFAGDVDGALDD